MDCPSSIQQYAFEWQTEGPAQVPSVLELMNLDVTAGCIQEGTPQHRGVSNPLHARLGECQT